LARYKNRASISNPFDLDLKKIEIKAGGAFKQDEANHREFDRIWLRPNVFLYLERASGNINRENSAHG
jgi:hypothetical protein